MAETADEKLKLAEQLVEKVTATDIPLDDLYIDPLVYPIATNTQSAVATLEAIERIMKGFSGVHTTCGLINVSHGLPARKLINRIYLASAMCRGLDFAILDPTNKQLYSALKAAISVNGRDDFSTEYITVFREERLE